MDFSVSISFNHSNFDFFIHNPADDLVVSKTIDKDRVWEESLSKVWLDSISAGDLVIDIGANIGWYSKIAKLKGADVISIEPDPRNFKILEKNCPDCFLYNCAVGKENKDIFLNYDVLNNYGDTRSTLTPGLVSAQQFKLDDIVSKFNKKVKAIKIDVQGWEPYVIEGGYNTFLNLDQGAVVILEFCPSILKTNGFNLNCFDEFFKMFSYQYGIRKNKKMSFEEMFKFLKEIENDKRSFYVDTVNIV